VPWKAKRPCNAPGCSELVPSGERYCQQHKRQEQRRYDERRGTAHERGYTYRWSKYSKWFLRQHGNQICKLRIDGRCTLAAGCVDHTVPPKGPSDPLFWDPDNHQASCVVCNSIKGKREIAGSEWEL
jgi:5-methylcytosine-specific restriction enzyme A